MNADARTTLADARTHAPFLDLMRATAAFLVLIGHTRNLLFVGIAEVPHAGVGFKAFWAVTVLQHQAVVVFFVLSGVLVGGAVVAAMRSDRFDLAEYPIARFSRIFIVYVPALLLTVAVFWIGGMVFADSPAAAVRPLFSEAEPYFGGLRRTLCHAAAVQGFLCTEWKQNPPLWSLGYEWVLYLFAPAVLWLVLRRGRRKAGLVGVALLVCGSCAMAADLKEWLFWATAWFLGVAASQVSRTHDVPLSAGLAGLAVAVCGMPVAHLQIVPEMQVDLVIALGTALAVACRPLATLAAGRRFFVWAAGFSYTLYAINVPVIYLAATCLQRLGFPSDKMQPDLQGFAAFGLCVAAALVAAWALSLVTERRTDRLRTWLRAALLPCGVRAPQAETTAAVFSVCRRRT